MMWEEGWKATEIPPQKGVLGAVTVEDFGVGVGVGVGVSVGDGVGVGVGVDVDVSVDFSARSAR